MYFSGCVVDYVDLSTIHFALEKGVLQPFQCQIGKQIEISSYEHHSLNEPEMMIDGSTNLNFRTKNGPVPAWFKIDLGAKPCQIFQIIISGWDYVQMGFLNVTDSIFYFLFNINNCR